MRPPIQFRVVLRPSRIATCALVALAGFAIVLLVLMPAPAWTDALAALVLIGWAAHRIEELVSGARIIRPAYRDVLKNRSYLPLSERR